MTDDDADHGGEYEKNNNRAHLAAYVLIAGLVAELVIAYFWFHGTETLLEMVAILLIVGGVWGEVHFGNKARIAGDKELAKFKARAAEAQLALEKYKQPRNLDIDSFLEKLKGVPPRKVQVLYVRECSDCSWVAQFIGSFLNTANWDAEWAPIDEKAAASGPWRFQPIAISVRGYPWGITIVAKDITEDALRLSFGESIEALRAALWESFKPSVMMAEDGDMPSDVIRVVVAPKP